MLETRYRSKLPRFAAWPVTTGRLNQALGAASQLSGADLHYSDYGINRFAAGLKAAARAKPYQVLRVYFSAGRWNQNRVWSFWVSAIPADRAPRIRTLVNEEFLPRLLQWLETHKTPPENATIQRLSFSVSYCEAEDRLVYDDGL